MFFVKLFSYFFSKLITVSTRSDMNNCRFNMNIYILHCFFKALVSIDLNTGCITFQEGHQCFCLLMIFLNFLRQNT